MSPRQQVVLNNALTAKEICGKSCSAMYKSVKIDPKKLAAIIDGNQLYSVSAIARFIPAAREVVSRYKDAREAVVGVRIEYFTRMAEYFKMTPEELLAAVGVSKLRITGKSPGQPLLKMAAQKETASP